MARKNVMDDLHSKVLRKFHALCSMCGLSDYEKMAIVESFGVESSADIDTHDLINICNKLSKDLGQNDKASEIDKLRKQVFAAIGGYLKKVGRQSNPEIIKNIACRATKYESFNKIPAERLRNIYSAFVNKQKDIDGADEAMAAMLAEKLIASGGFVTNGYTA